MNFLPEELWTELEYFSWHPSVSFTLFNQGVAQLSVTSLSASESDDMFVAPGDFTAIDSEGEIQQLESFGKYITEVVAWQREWVFM